jgi:glycosyltransferase involved in cell wall biosynthesis
MTSLKLCIIGKYPPIQGGVSRQMYWLARCCAELGHEVHYITNAEEVELEYRMYIPPAERSQLECSFENGGFVKLHTTRRLPRTHYIPYTNPFVSKLAALAFDVVKRYGCSFIYTSYLEPYGFAGALASQWTGLPYSVQHAGSDVGRLAQISERQSAYLELIRNADLVIASNSMVRPLLSVEVEPEKLFTKMPGYLPGDYFTSQGTVLDIAQLLDDVKDTGYSSPISSSHVFDPSKPTIGLYGKTGQFKGTSELIQALAQLKREGNDFNFVAVCGTQGQRVKEFQIEIKDNEIEDRTYLLPYIPHWLIPQFIRACTAVCFLENRFPILIHKPQVPREVLACGRCLILSQEIRDKQLNRDDFIDRENYLLILDPQNIQYLASTLKWVIENPETALNIGTKGNLLYKGNNNISVYQDLIDRIKEVTESKIETIMSLAEFQRLSLKLYTNSSFQRLLQDNAENVLQGYDLSQRERETLTKLASMQPSLQKFTESLYRKKFNFLWKQFGTVNQYFSFIEKELFSFFKETYDFESRSSTQEVDYFAELLTSFAKHSDMSLPHCFAEIVKYDRTTRHAVLLPSTNQTFARINETSSVQEFESLDYFVKSASIIIETFRYHLVSLHQEASPETMKKEEHTLVFVPSLEGLVADVHDIPPTIQYMLQKAEQPRSLKDLIREAALFNGMEATEAFRQACIQSIRDLYIKRILVGFPEPSKKKSDRHNH